jgi:hypothetical protein
VSERALREPDGIERREQSGCGGDGDLAGDAMGKSIDGEEGE